jgi:hypothetical protein
LLSLTNNGRTTLTVLPLGGIVTVWVNVTVAVPFTREIG